MKQRLNFICPKCDSLYSYRIECPDCNVMVVKAVKKQEFKRIRRHSMNFKEWPSDSQLESFKRGKKVKLWDIFITF